MKAPEKFLLALVAALALLLAGCGGGSNNDGGDGDGDDDSMTMTEPPPPVPSPADRAKDYRLAAVDAGNDLDDAVAAAMQAVNGADEKADGKGGSEGYSTMLTALATHGESRTAQENAQKILDAQGAVNAAAMSAKDALMAAQQALTNAMALPAGTAGRMEAVEELQMAIATLEKQITIDDDGMHMLVKKAKDSDDGLYEYDDMGMGTPADSAVAVAEEIRALLAPPATVGPATSTPRPDMDKLFAMGDTATAAMRTYDQIFTTEPIADRNALVQAVPLAGMTADVDIDGVDAPNVDGVPYNPSGGGYMGIPGSVLCRKDGGCAGVGEDDEVGEGWYFVPDSDHNNGGTVGAGTNWRTALLSKSGEVYELATYAKYGVWFADTTGALNLYSESFGKETPDNGDTTDFEMAREGSATYAGTARGLSVRYSRNPVTGTRTGQQSGEFMADVRLTLDFGDEDDDEAMLSGVVNNFTGVHNAGVVHSGWEVELKGSGTDKAVSVAAAMTPILPATQAMTMSKGPAALEGADGRWTANPFGSHVYDDMDNEDDADDELIAMGYHGGFNANFTNGHVAGVYAAEVEE